MHFRVFKLLDKIRTLKMITLSLSFSPIELAILTLQKKPVNTFCPNLLRDFTIAIKNIEQDKIKRAVIITFFFLFMLQAVWGGGGGWRKAGIGI